MRRNHFAQSYLAQTFVALVIFFSFLVTSSSAQPPKTQLNGQLPAYTRAYKNKVKQAKVQFKTRRNGQQLAEILTRHDFHTQHLRKAMARQLLTNELSLSIAKIYRVLQAEHDFLELRFYDARENMAFVFWRLGEDAGSFATQAELSTQKREFRNQVSGSLISSVEAATGDQWVAYRFLDAFSLDFAVIKNLQRGAGFYMLVEERFDGKQKIGFGEVLEARLDTPYGQLVRHFVALPQEGGTFVDSQGRFDDRPLYLPVNYLRVSSHFAWRRVHPIRQKRKPHLGVDFELPTYAPVFAAQRGVVLRTGYNRGAGNFIVIRHGPQLETSYNHLSSVASGLRVGQNIYNGQRIGAIGCTGLCTRAHLHFAVKKGGRYVNPMDYVRSYPFHSADDLAVNK